jgi:hypothetical protein
MELQQHGNRYGYGVYGYTVSNAVWFTRPQVQFQCQQRYGLNDYPYQAPCWRGLGWALEPCVRPSELN